MNCLQRADELRRFSQRITEKERGEGKKGKGGVGAEGYILHREKGAGGRCYLHDHLTEPQRLRHVTEQIRSITKNADCCHRDLFLNFPGLGSIRTSTARVRAVDEAFVM